MKYSTLYIIGIIISIVIMLICIPFFIIYIKNKNKLWCLWTAVGFICGGVLLTFIFVLLLVFNIKIEKVRVVVEENNQNNVVQRETIIYEDINEDGDNGDNEDGDSTTEEEGEDVYIKEKTRTYTNKPLRQVSLKKNKKVEEEVIDIYENKDKKPTIRETIKKISSRS